MAKFVYKKSRKKCVADLDETLTDLDIWSGHFMNAKDTFGNCITDLEEGCKRKKVISEIEKNYKTLINMQYELAEFISDLDNKIYELKSRREK